MSRKMLRRQAGEEPLNVTWQPDWMAQLPEACRELSVTKLAIPGSHNTLAVDADMRTDLDFTPYNPDLILTIHRLPDYPIFSRFKGELKEVWKVWGACQSLTITQQLELGVRYLDFRMAKTNGTIHGEHGLYTRPVMDYIHEVNNFLNKHPKEVVFLHVQNLNNLDKKDKEELINSLHKIFQRKLCPPSMLGMLSLQALWQYRYQVLVFFREVDIMDMLCTCDISFIWAEKQVDNCRKDVKSFSQMKGFLNARYAADRQDDQLHIIQGILCPDLDMVFGDFKYNTRKELCKYDVNHALTKWIQEGRTNLNVLTVDFVEFANIVPSIIQLNHTKV